MTRNTLLRVGFALLVAGMLALLGGCGGDGDGVDQSVHDMALQAQMDAEAAQAAAEAEAAAEKARADAAEQAQMDAEADAMAAEQAQMDAEAEAMATAAELANTRAHEVVDALDRTAPDGNIGIVEIEFGAKGAIDVTDPDGRAWDDATSLAEFTDWDDESYTRDTRRTRPDGMESLHVYKYKLAGRKADFEDEYMLNDAGQLVIDTEDIDVEATVVTEAAATTPVMIGNINVQFADAAQVAVGTTQTGTARIPLSMASQIMIDRDFGSDNKVTIDDLAHDVAAGEEGEPGEPGTFHGADGQYFCSAEAGCIVEQDGDGNLYLDGVPVTATIENRNGDLTVISVVLGTAADEVDRLLHFVPDDDDATIVLTKDSYLLGVRGSRSPRKPTTTTGLTPSRSRPTRLPWSPCPTSVTWAWTAPQSTKAGRLASGRRRTWRPTAPRPVTSRPTLPST